MTYKGEDFVTDRGAVTVRVYDDGHVRIGEFGSGDLTEETASNLADFIKAELYEVRKARGDYDQNW